MTHAQITGPIACNGTTEGKMIYNDDLNILQFCDGNNWMALGGSLSEIWDKSGSDIYYDMGNVGIGTTNPLYPLDVDGTANTKALRFVDQTGSHINTDGALYRTGGQAYLTVDDNFYIRDDAGALPFHFNTTTGTLAATAFVGDGSGLTGLPSGADNLGSGGSTSGTLYSQNGSGYGYLGSSGTNYIRFDDVSQGNEAYVRLNGNWEYHMHPSYFRPYTDNANDLGTSSQKWQDIWAYDTMTNRICNEAGSSCKTPESLLTSESDPQVSAVTSGKWCRGTGSAVTCDQDVPNSSVPNGTLCGLAQAAGSTSCSGYTNLMTCLGINIANGTCPSGYTSKTVEFSFSTGGFNFVRLCTRTCSKM